MSAPDRPLTLQTVARAGLGAGQPTPLFAAAATALANTVGWRMLTVMLLRPEQLELKRVYSSDPVNYPPGGRKSKRGLPWTDQVLLRGEAYVGRDDAGLRWAFDDADRLQGLGLGAVINQPIVWDGRVLGTLNLLDAAGSYGEAWQTEATAAVAALLRPALLAAAYQPSA